MANYCEYEIHVRGTKKATLFFYTMTPALDDKEIIHEEGTDDDYIVWITGNCKNSLDCYCKENPDVKIDLDKFTEDDIRNNENIGLDYWYLTMRQKSEMLGLKIEANSWSEESDFDMLEEYDNGTLLDTLTIEYPYRYPSWYKEDYPTYAEFCDHYGIDPAELPEDVWYKAYEGEEYEDIFFCDEEAYKHYPVFFDFSF